MIQPAIANKGEETDQFSQTKNEEFRKSLTQKDTKWVDHSVV